MPEPPLVPIIIDADGNEVVDVERGRLEQKRKAEEVKGIREKAQKSKTIHYDKDQLQALLEKHGARTKQDLLTLLEAEGIQEISKLKNKTKDELMYILECKLNDVEQY
jgi:hypothetical protein